MSVTTKAFVVGNVRTSIQEAVQCQERHCIYGFPSWTGQMASCNVARGELQKWDKLI